MSRKFVIKQFFEHTRLQQSVDNTQNVNEYFMTAQIVGQGILRLYFQTTSLMN